MEESLLDINGAATYLAVSTATVRRLSDSGEIPRLKLRGSLRFRRSSLDAFIAENEKYSTRKKKRQQA